MLSVKRILRDYEDARSVNSLISVWGFVDDSAFLTKAGHVGLVYLLRGVDYEGLTHAQRAAIVHRLEAALRLLDEHWRIYQYVVKRTIPPVSAAACSQPVANEAIQERVSYLNGRRSELFEIRLFVVLLYEPPTRAHTTVPIRDFWKAPFSALKNWLSPAVALHLLDENLERAVATLHHKADAFQVQLSDLGLAKLPKTQAFRFFRELVNYDEAVIDAATLRYDTHVDYFVSDSAVECHRDHLQVGRRHVKVLSMKEPPGQTFADLLRDLHAIPGEFVACLEWQRISSDRMRRDLQTRRRHFFNKRVSIVNYVTPEARPEEMLVDDSAGATVRQLGDALTEIEVNGHFFGSVSLTVVLHGEDPRALQHQAAEAQKTMAVHDGSLFEETYTLDVFLFRLVCGNHIIWGFQHVAGFRRRHVGASIQAEWTTSLNDVRTALDADTADDRTKILRAMTQELGSSRDAVVDTAVQRLDVSQKQAGEAHRRPC